MFIFGDMLSQDMDIRNGQGQKNNQLSTDQGPQILDFPISAFLESTNSKDGGRTSNSSISCSSHSFSEIPSEMELYQALSKEFPHNDFHCQKLCHPDSNIMLETSIIDKEVLDCSLLDRMDHVTGCENSEMDTIPQDILNIINHENEYAIGSIDCTKKSNNLSLQQDHINISHKTGGCQEAEQVHDKVPQQCSVCLAQALKYSSYGGKVCSSCRAFFRRSVQSGYHALFECKVDQRCSIQHQISRKCQFCRFQSCLSSGMKLNMVLSSQERHSRFNKLKKATKTIIKSEADPKYEFIARPSVLSTSYSNEEQMILENLNMKMHSTGSWLQNLLIFDRRSAVNLIEYTYGHAELKKGSWETFQRSLGYNFGKYILPTFEESMALSPHDIGQVMNSSNAGIAHFFRSCQSFWMGSGKNGTLEIKHDHCYIASHVSFFLLGSISDHSYLGGTNF
jgi:hypothetical protein